MKAALESVAKFIVEPALPRLSFRPLKGHSGHFIINGKHGDRIILRKVEDDLYELVDVGPHDNIYRRLDRR